MSNDDIKRFMEMMNSVEEEGYEESYEEDSDNDESEEYVEVEDEFILPSHWGPALINGDYTGLSDEEEQELQDFLDDFPIANYIVNDVEELGFRHYNDAGTEPTDVSLYKAYKRVPQSESSQELLEEKMMIGKIDNKRQLKHHIAQHFDEYEKQLKLLYPKEQKEATDVLVDFLKDRSLEGYDLNELQNTLTKKIRDADGPYDTIATLIDHIQKVV